MVGGSNHDPWFVTSFSLSKKSNKFLLPDVKHMKESIIGCIIGQGSAQKILSGGKNGCKILQRRGSLELL